MFNQFNSRLTRAAQNMQEEVSNAIKANSPPRTMPNSMVKRQSRQSHKEPFVPNKDHKRAALFIRNLLRHALRRPFKIMLVRIVFKKIAFALLATKKKKNMQWAFLTIRGFTLAHNNTRLNDHLLRSTQSQLLAKLYYKLQKRRVGAALAVMRGKVQRRKHLHVFTELLAQSTNRVARRVFLAPAMAKIRQICSRAVSKSIHAPLFIRLGQKIKRRSLQWAFDKIADTLLHTVCVQSLQVKKSKNAQMKEVTLSKKEQAIKLKEKMKALKTELDQQRVERNKVVQQRKKYANNTRLPMLQSVRKFEKDRKTQQALFRQITTQYQERERVGQLRNGLILRSRQASVRCHQLFVMLKSGENQVRNIRGYRPLLVDQLKDFEQSEVFLFKQNLKMQKLLQIYEGRGGLSFEALYYEMQYQNNVVLQTLRCFMNERYEAGGADRSRGQQSLSEQEIKNLVNDLSWS